MMALKHSVADLRERLAEQASCGLWDGDVHMGSIPCAMIPAATTISSALSGPTRTCTREMIGEAGVPLFSSNHLQVKEMEEDSIFVRMSKGQASKVTLATLGLFCPAIAAAESLPSASLRDATITPAAATHERRASLSTNSDSALSPGFANRRAAYITTLTRRAEHVGVPAALADAVAFVESAYNPRAIGAAGEVGLMQILPATAAMLGFRSDLEDLANPETNLHYGVGYLAGAWRLSGGDVCQAVAKYRSGHGEQRITPLSLEYCRKVLAYLTGIGSPLASRMPSALQANGAPLAPPSEALRQASPRRTEDAGIYQRSSDDARRFQQLREARLRAARSQLLLEAGQGAPGLQRRWPGFRRLP